MGRRIVIAGRGKAPPYRHREAALAAVAIQMRPPQLNHGLLPG